MNGPVLVGKRMNTSASILNNGLEDASNEGAEVVLWGKGLIAENP